MLRRNIKKIIVGTTTLTGLGLYASKLTVDVLEEEFLNHPEKMKKFTDHINFSKEAIDPILELREKLLENREKIVFKKKVQNLQDTNIWENPSTNPELMSILDEYDKKREESSKNLYKKIGISSTNFGLKLSFIKLHNPDLFQEMQNCSQLLYDYGFNGTLESFEKAVSFVKLEKNQILENKKLSKIWNNMVKEKNQRCFEKMENFFLMKDNRNISGQEKGEAYLRYCENSCPVLELRKAIKNNDFESIEDEIYDPVVMFFASRRLYEEREDDEEFLDFYQDGVKYDILQARNLAQVKKIKEKYIQEFEKLC